MKVNNKNLVNQAMRQVELVVTVNASKLADVFGMEESRRNLHNPHFV